MSYKQTAIPSVKMRPPVHIAYSKQLKQNDIGLENNSSKYK